jgi:hypothetical protein
MFVAWISDGISVGYSLVGEVYNCCGSVGSGVVVNGNEECLEEEDVAGGGSSCAPCFDLVVGKASSVRHGVIQVRKSLFGASWSHPG